MLRFRLHSKVNVQWHPLAWIMLAAVAGRAWLLFSTRFVPGVNGAYYLVQARALLERGRLGIADMPLTFYLHAALSWLLAKISGIALMDAIMVAVKVCDAVLPALVAWPVFVLVRRWAKARGRGDAVPLVAAALASLSLPWFLMVGELQKNSLALVWFALLATTLHGWLQKPTRGRGAALLAALFPLGLTHIGVFGAGLVLMATVLPMFVLRQGKLLRWKQLLPWLGAGMALLLVTTALVSWKFDPSRIRRLITAITVPSQFSSDGRQPPGRPDFPLSLDQWLPFFAFALMVVPSLIIAWRRRKELAAADFAVVAGGALTVLMLTGPWFSPDKSVRFCLIAVLPAILVGSFSLLYIARQWVQRAVLCLVLLTGIGSTFTILLPGGKPILEDTTMAELKGLALHIRNPERTLVVAEHGVEWWSAWLLNTYVAQPEALRPEDWQNYETILFLEVKSGQVWLPGRGGPAPFWVPGSVPGDSRLPRAEKRAHPQRPPLIPAGAELLYDGATLRLARVVTAPDFVRGN
jgi:hypothetical protein